MAKITKSVSTIYRLELNGKERKWLMKALQSAIIHGPTASDLETDECGEMRSSLYKVLQDCERE